MSQLKGGGGKPKTPASPTNTPDNLRSEDILEAIFGVTEGPWKGLTNGHKSFMVGDTVLQRQDGGYNFEDFEVITYPGNAFPEILKYRLGGESNNFSVNVPTAYGVPLTRQTAHGNIDFIDIRMAVSQLYQSVENGKNPGTFDNTFQFRIRYKPASSDTWAEWGDAAGMTIANPYFTQYDSDWSDGTVYNPETGVYTDMSESISGISKIWAVANFKAAVNYWKSQPQYVPNNNILSIRGKTTSTYIKEYRIPVQRIPEPYQIQVERISADSSLSGDPKYIAEVAWESFQTIDVELKRYPYTGFIQIIGKATDQFSSIPQFSGEGDGLIVKVPTNYNPETREYTGTWDGNFKEEWTNNPVWILYEAMHNDRWGWSAYSPVKWSRYEAYELAQICDFKLPNGRPRYTFNAYITDPMDGREFCRYIAGSFNSVIVDDDNGTVQVLMDKDDAAIQLYGPESIIGDFEYTYTDVNTRFNDLTVVFRNPEIDYAEDRRRVFDQAHIDQHGRIPYDFVAVGTTNDNEAVRKASRRLVSATTETEQVNFKTNRKASYLKPYDVILITDPIKGYGLSGRFKSYATTVATLRDPIYLEAGVSYGIDVQSDSGVVSLTLANVSTSGFTSTLTFTNPIPNTLDQKAQFSLKDSNSLGLPKPYRVLDVHPEDEEQDQWAVFAIEINRNKFAAEDNAEIVGEPVYTSVKKKEPSLPTNPRAMNATRAAPDGTMLYKARVDFTPPADPYVSEYWVRYRQVGQVEYEVLPVDGTGIEIDLPRDGSWEFQVQSRNIWEQQSPWLATNPTSVVIDKPNGITGGSITAIAGDFNQIRVTVAFPAQTDIRYARLYASQTNNSGTANMVVRGDTQNLVHTNLLANSTWYYWVKFEDNLGNVGPFTSAAGAGVSATTRLLGGGDIADGSIGTNKFVPGFTGVENVNSLPTTGNYEGRMVLLSTDNKLYTYKNNQWVSVIPDISGAGIEKVDTLPTGLGMADQGKIVFLKSDNKIYRWTGTAWTAQTSATDVTGFLQASNFPSTLRPVENVSALPGAPHTEGRIVFLTTDDKLYRNTGSGWTSATSTSDLTGTLGSSLFSNSLRPPEVVASLPASGNFQGKLVILTTDNKLYRWTGSAWTSAVATSDLTGTISDTQIAGMSAAKLVGQLNDSQIASIAAAKVAGQLSDSQIANIAAAKIAGQLSSSQLQGIEAAKLLGAVQGTQIAANTITGGNIFGGTITGDKIAGRTITGGNIVGGTITGFEIVGDTITGTHIRGSTITGGNIVGGTITGGHIAANTITAANLTAGIITAGYIAAKAITVDKLAIGSTDNLITNGQFQSEAQYDPPLAWSRLIKPNPSDTVRVVVDTSNTWPVKKVLELNRQVASSGELSAWADNLAFDYADYWEKGSLLAQPGDEFYVESQVFSSQANIARIDVVGRQANGTLVGLGSFVLEDMGYSSVSNNQVTINNSGWLKSMWTFKYTGTAPAKIGLRFLNVGTSAGQYVLFGNILMRRRNTGMLLVDGAVTARNIAASTITGDKITAGTITAGLIASQAIEVKHLKVSTGDMNPDALYNSFGPALGYSAFWQYASSTPDFNDFNANPAGHWYNEWVQDHYPEEVRKLGTYKVATLWGGQISQAGDPLNRRYILYFGGHNRPEQPNGGIPIRGNTWYEVTIPYANRSNQAMKVYIETFGTNYAWLDKPTFPHRVKAGDYYYDAQPGTSGVLVLKFQTWEEAISMRLNISNQTNGGTFEGAISIGKVVFREAFGASAVIDGSLTAQQLKANSITGDRLVAGTITSAYIAARSITTSSLSVVPTSIFPDPEFRELGTEMWPTVQSWYPEDRSPGNSTDVMGITRGMVLWSGTNTVGTSRQHLVSKWLGGVTGGQVLRVRAVGVNNSNQAMGVTLQFRNSATGAEQYPEGVYWQSSAGYATLSRQFTVPAGCDQYRFVAYNGANNNFEGAVVIGGIDISLAATSDLLVDGAITAVKIAAATITGGNIAGGTITGDKIAANTITAGNISVANLAAINSNLGNITAGNINMEWNGRRVRINPGFGVNGDLLFWAGPSSVGTGSETIDNGVIAVSATDGFFGGKTPSGPFDSTLLTGEINLPKNTWTTVASVSNKYMYNNAYIVASLTSDIYVQGAPGGNDDYSYTSRLIVTNTDGSNPVEVPLPGLYSTAYPNTWIPGGGLSFRDAVVSVSRGLKNMYYQINPSGANITTAKVRNRRLKGAWTQPIT